MVGLGRIGVPVHLRDNVSTFLRLYDALNPTVTLFVVCLFSVQTIIHKRNKYTVYTVGESGNNPTIAIESKV